MEAGNLRRVVASNQETKPLRSKAADLEAVERTLAGDREAFGELVERWQGRIYGAVVRMIRDRELARDLTQDAFLKAYEKLGSFQGGAAFGTWLYSIALNVVRSEIRRRSAKKNRPPLSLDALGGAEEGSEYDPPDDAPGAVERLVTREQCRALLAAIDELDGDQREVIVLREFQGLSYDEIAEAVGVPVGTVRSRLFRARNELRRRLVDEVGS